MFEEWRKRTTNWHRFAALSTPCAFLALATASILGEGTTYGDYWVFVVFYAMLALYAFLTRLWVGAVMAVSVTLVRTLVALRVSGVALDLASSGFAAVLFLLVQQVGWTRHWRR